MRFPVDPVMRRGLDIDVLECPDCGERLRFVATVMLSSAIRRILRHLGLPSDPVELAPHELGTVPPDILSETGADLFVKTNEGPGQNEPRLRVYDFGCSPDRWRRVSDNTCL